MKRNRVPVGVGRVDPDGAAVVFDDLLAQRQPDAGAAVGVAAVQALEDDEHLVDELRGDADAVVRHGEQPLVVRRVPRSHSIDDPRRDALAAELHRVADQVLPQHRQQRRIADDLRQRVGRADDLGAGLLDRDRRGCPAPSSSAASRSTSACGGVEPADPREGQQVVDQHLHALGAVDGEGDVLDAALVELVAVALLEQLAERGDLAQRLLQVVRGDVGELLEFGVGPAQFDGLFVQLGARPSATRSSSSTIRCRMFSTSAAMARMSLGPCGTICSSKLPSVIRRHAAASDASGRVTALRITIASATAVTQKRHDDARPEPRCARLRIASRFVDARRPRRGEVLVLGVEQRSDAVEFGLAALGDAGVDDGRACRA